MNTVRYLFLSIYLTATFYGSSSHAGSGDTRGNGGDSLFCRHEPNAEFSGSYVLDFVAMASSDERGINSVGATDKQIDYAQQIFRERGFTELADSLGRFLDLASAQIFHGSCAGCEKVWRKARLGLIDLKDDLLFTKLPSNCYTLDKPTPLIQLQQLVIRQEITGTPSIIFDYDPVELEKIVSQPYQYSFLLVHEWLWQHVDRADAIRNLNWYLHSKQMLDDKDVDILYTLANLGFKFNATSLPRNKLSKLTFSNSIEVTYLNENHPNGRRVFTTPEFLVINPSSQALTFHSPGVERFDLFLFDEASNSRIDLCKSTSRCEIKLDQSWKFPLTLAIERENMLDPIWDSARVYLFQ